MSDRKTDHLREQIADLEKQVTELKRSIGQARKETREQLSAHINRAKTEIADRQDTARRQAEKATGRAQSQWQSITADTAAKLQDLQDRVDRKRDQRDVKRAEKHAEIAEENAADAMDFAWWAVAQAQVAVLDAGDARAWADELTAASPAS